MHNGIFPHLDPAAAGDRQRHRHPAQGPEGPRPAAGHGGRHAVRVRADDPGEQQRRPGPQPGPVVGPDRRRQHQRRAGVRQDERGGRQHRREPGHGRRPVRDDLRGPRLRQGRPDPRQPGPPEPAGRGEGQADHGPAQERRKEAPTSPSSSSSPPGHLVRLAPACSFACAASRFRTAAGPSPRPALPAVP